MNKALICIDFINEIVGENGVFGKKGNYEFIKKHNTLPFLAKFQTEFRNSGGFVIHVHLGYENNYADHPASSPLLGPVRHAGILKMNTFSTAIPEIVAPHENDMVILKKRISAFYGTSLDVILRSINAAELYIAGVSTDLAVQSTARDAHDRDYTVTIVSGACAAAEEEAHLAAIKNMAKFARIL